MGDRTEQETTRTMPSGYMVTLPAGSVLRADGTSTCPATAGKRGDHNFVPNQTRTGFACSWGCGARVETPR